ncbi:hypothetical protein L596_008895 [Steinernema carpocapsae]|uniref:BTB domain-containing protein n=1 Tax=Steinernema carpocapsae TaxID=34508 RepID=A0A4U5PEB8_STECR|nr:hypothetical protein L596_008895 [Steinernema carpocapsae]
MATAMEVDSPASVDTSFQCPPCATKTKLSLEVGPDNFAFESVEVGELNWICSYQVNEANIGYFTISCGEPDTLLWSAELLLKVEVYSTVEIVENFYESKVINLYSSKEHDTIKMFPVSTKKEFTGDSDSFNIEITVSVGRIWKEDLSKITSFGSAFVMVADRELYVSRELLSMHSSYFYTLFEKNEAVTLLERISFEDLFLFLSATYPVNFEITDDNVKKLLHVAMVFQSSSLISRCLVFLEQSSFTNIARIEIANKYNLQGFLIDTINKMTRSNIEDLACGSKPISDDLKLQLFDRLVRLCDDDAQFDQVAHHGSAMVNQYTTNSQQRHVAQAYITAAASNAILPYAVYAVQPQVSYSVMSTQQQAQAPSVSVTRRPVSGQLRAITAQLQAQQAQQANQNQNQPGPQALAASLAQAQASLRSANALLVQIGQPNQPLQQNSSQALTNAIVRTQQLSQQWQQQYNQYQQQQQQQQQRAQQMHQQLLQLVQQGPPGSSRNQQPSANPVVANPPTANRAPNASS